MNTEPHQCRIGSIGYGYITESFFSTFKIAHLIETSQLICQNQLTDFYMIETLVLIWFNGIFIKNMVFAVFFHVPASIGINKHHSYSALVPCVQRIYIYKELKSRVDDVAYLGIANNIKLDGMKPDGDLCQTTKQFEREPDPDCRPMQKTLYMQVLLW